MNLNWENLPKEEQNRRKMPWEFYDSEQLRQKYFEYDPQEGENICNVTANPQHAIPFNKTSEETLSVLDSSEVGAEATVVSRSVQDP